MTLDIAARRTELQAELAKHERAAGEALLNGDKGMSARDAIRKIRAEIEALNSAEGVSSDRRRADEEAKRLGKLAELRSALAAEWQDYQQHYERAEMAARNFADASGRIIETERRISRLMHLVTNDSVPSGLGRSVLNRLSMRLISIIGSVKDCRNHFGLLPLKGNTGLFDPSHCWLEKEIRALGASIEGVIAGAQPKPREELLQITHQKEDAVNVASSNGKA